MTNAHPAEASARRLATRERLLKASLDVFSQVGLQAATVEQIAERAGFTRGAFYSNFASKEELFLSLTSQQAHSQFAVLSQMLDDLELGEDIDEEQLAQSLVKLLDVALSDPRMTVITQEFWLAAVRDPDVAKDFVALRTELIAHVRSLVDPILKRTHRTYAMDPDLACRVIVNTYHDGVRDAVAREMDTDEVRRILAAVVFAVTRPQTR